jgi:hypothetical protein
MKKNKEYNGYKNYSYWNQSLYINKDSELYYFALECLNCYKNTKRATNVFIDNLTQIYTPDGIMWTKSGVYNALMSLKKDSI